MNDLTMLEKFARNLFLREAADLAKSMSVSPDDWLSTYAVLCLRYHTLLNEGREGLARASAELQTESLYRHPPLLWEVTRLLAELDEWSSNENPRARAYVHFVTAYHAMIHCDGERMSRALQESAQSILELGPDYGDMKDVLRFFAAETVGEVFNGSVWSSYGAVQVVGDRLVDVVSLKVHTFEDLRRFTLMPVQLSERSVPA